MFIHDLINSNNDKNNLSVIPKTSQEYICVKYGCVKFLDSMRFQEDSLDKLPESLKDQDYLHLKQQFPKHWIIHKRKLVYPYQFYKTLEGYEKPIEELLKSCKEVFLVRLIIKAPKKKKYTEQMKFYRYFYHQKRSWVRPQ